VPCDPYSIFVLIYKPNMGMSLLGLPVTDA
jgi:hypothetical protein